MEGRLERRLGAAGSEAEIRLEVNLPPPSDPIRSAVEVLWDLLPEVLADDLAGVRSRVDSNQALFEAQTESSSADLAVRKLRLGLARFSENPAYRRSWSKPPPGVCGFAGRHFSKSIRNRRN